MQAQKKNFLLIQLMRGIASMIVVLLHITINFSENLHKPFLNNIFTFGGSGVDIFFVLSGFIITYTNLQSVSQPSAVNKFITRRFIRIFPIYWITITLFLLLQLLLPAFYKTHFNTGFANLIQTYLLLPGHNMINGVSWSLTNELFFYLLFTVALIMPNKKITFYLLVGYFTFLLIFSIAVPAVFDGNPYKELLIFPMNIEFILGVIIVLIVDRLSKKLIYPLLILGIICFIAGAFMLNSGISVISNRSSLYLNRVLLFGFPSFLIILSLVRLEISRSIKIHNVFLQLGDASYSIYLIHLPVVAAFFKVLAKLNITNNGLLVLLSCLLFIAVCAAGIFIYQKVEQPLIKKLNKLFL